MHITGEMKMVDVIQKDIQLLAVIQRLNIALGFREKTIEEVCLDQKVDLSFFLSLANAFHDKDYFKAEYFKDFPVKWVIDYLKNAHKCYIEFRIPELERQISILEQKINPNEKNLSLTLNFFREYIREFVIHIKMEESKVFPYILELDEKLNRVKSGDTEFVSEEKHSVSKYHEEHNDIEESLFDLKNILLKHLPQTFQNCEYNNLILDIFRLECDLLDHAELEDHVLFPRVAEMENELIDAIKNLK